MSDSFFSRWSRQKSLNRDLDNARDAAEEQSQAKLADASSVTNASVAGAATALPTSPTMPTSPTDANSEPLPTMDDSDALEVGANVSRFLRDGVSDAVKGAALKKLFADPAYNFISDMDDYVEDYSKMATMTTAEVRKLQQSKDLFLFEAPPWKVEAEAKAKAKAAALAQAEQDKLATEAEQPQGDQNNSADAGLDESIDDNPDEGETTQRQPQP